MSYNRRNHSSSSSASNQSISSYNSRNASQTAKPLITRSQSCDQMTKTSKSNDNMRQKSARQKIKDIWSGKVERKKRPMDSMRLTRDKYNAERKLRALDIKQEPLERPVFDISERKALIDKLVVNRSNRKVSVDRPVATTSDPKEPLEWPVFTSSDASEDKENNDVFKTPANPPMPRRERFKPQKQKTNKRSLSESEVNQSLDSKNANIKRKSSEEPPEKASSSGQQITNYPNITIDKQMIKGLVKEVDSDQELDDEVVDQLMAISDDFIEKTINFAANLAKSRQSKGLDVKDVGLALDKRWDMQFPEFDTGIEKRETKLRKSGNIQDF